MFLHYCPTNVLSELVDQRLVVQQVLKSKRRSSNKSAGNQLLGTFKCNQGFNFDLALDAAELINKYSTVANPQNFPRVSGLHSFCGFHPNLHCVAGVILGICWTNRALGRWPVKRKRTLTCLTFYPWPILSCHVPSNHNTNSIKLPKPIVY